MPYTSPFIDTAWLAFPILLSDNTKFKRKDLQKYLEKKNIQTRVIFTGNILRQPGFKNIKRKKSKSSYPNADFVMKNGILIGCHQGMSKKTVDEVHMQIKKFRNINS